jgi:hypothetical protein
VPFSQTTGKFGFVTTVTVDKPGNTKLNEGGALNENATTGQLGLIWPTFTGTKGTMRLWTSTNGTAWGSPRAIATIAAGFTGTPSLAVNSTGNGFVAFQTRGDLQIANFAKVPKPKKHKKHKKPKKKKG